MPFRRAVRAAAATALVAVVAAPALPGAGNEVLAHAQLVASSPGAGTVTEAPPAELRLVFSEPLEEQLTSLDLVGPDGAVLLSRAGDVDRADEYALVVAAPQLDDGVYEVRWRTLSAADGHTAEGSFTFGIGDVERALPESGAGGMTHTEAEPNRIIGRWLTYPGLLLAVGMPAFFAIVLRRTMPRPTLRLLAWALATSTLATVVLAIAAAIEAGSVTGYLLGTRNGGLQVGRAVVTAVGAVAVMLLPTRWAAAAPVGSGVAGITLLIAAGHAAAQPDWVATLVGLVHVAGTAVWAGGVVGLVLLVVRPDVLGSPLARLGEAIPRFSALALVSIGLVLASGAYSAWIHSGALVSTDTRYGLILLVKTIIAAAALAVGGLNFLDAGRLRPWLGGLPVRLRAETALIAAVLVVSALLALTSPDTDPAVAIEPLPDAFGEVAPGLALSVSPGRPGVNRVVVSTTAAMAGSVNLDLVLDRLDTGTSTRVTLMGEDMAGMDHSGMGMASSPEDAIWMADAVVLPPGSAWDTNVVIQSRSGDELSRQRFAFALDDSGVADGRVESLIDPGTVLAGLLLVGGALAAGLSLGGFTLPRTDPAASRVALLVGGTVAVVLGASIGATRLLG